MFNIFNLSKSKYSFAVLLVVLFCFIISLSSCTTTETYTINEPKTISHDGIIDIMKVVTKDSTVYTFKEDEAVYKTRYKDKQEVIVFNSGTEKIDSTVFKISRHKYLLFLNDLSSVKYSRRYVTTTDMLATIGLVSLCVALIGLILFSIVLSSGKFRIG